MGGSAQSMSMRFMQMRSGLSAVRDGAMGAFIGGQRADMMFMAMGHHFTSLINETGSLKGAFSALGASLMGAGGVILALTVAFELFQKFGKGEKEAYDAAKNFSSALDAQKQVAGTLDDSYAKAVSNVAELTKNVQLAKDGFISKTEVVKEYNDTLGKTMGAVKTLSEVEAKLVAGAPDYIKMMLYKAAAQTALKEASDKALEAAKVSLKPQEEFKPTFLPASSFGKNAFQGGQLTDDANRIAEQKQNEAKKKFTDDQNTLLKIFNDFQDKAAAIAGKNHWSFMPKDDPKAEKAKDGFKAIEAEIDKIKVKLEDAVISKQPTIAKQLAIDLETAEYRLQELKKTYANSLLAGGGASQIELHAPGVSNTGEGKLADGTKAGQGVDRFIIPNSLQSDSVTGDEIEKAVKAHIEWQNQIWASVRANQAMKAEIKGDNMALREMSQVIGHGLMSAFESAMQGTQSFVQAMGQFLTQLVEKLIAAAAAAAILSVLLSATGFGGMGFGQIFGQLSGLGAFTGGNASGVMPVNATDGIFTQPHVGMFAEAGPEAIVTPKHLADFAGVQHGGGFHDGQIVGVLRGQDIQLQYTRSAKTKSRLS